MHKNIDDSRLLQQAYEGSVWRFTLREAAADEFDTLCSIDFDASQLFDHVGLELTAQAAVEYTAAERGRWMECLQSGTVLMALNRSDEPIGFAALRALDHEPYLEQLSVRVSAMRKGVGGSL